MLSASSLVLGAKTHLKVINGDSRGEVEFNPKFKVTAEMSTGDLEVPLNEYAGCYLEATHTAITSLSWIYEGPPHKFVLSPASIRGPFSSENLRLFKFEKPEDLKGNAATRIMTKMRSNVLAGWRKAEQEVEALRSIYVQTLEQTGSGVGSLTPTPLRKFYLALVKDCCVQEGWDGHWDFKRATAEQKAAYLKNLHDYGLTLVKEAAPCCDVLTYRCLAHGADRWFHSHVKQRADDWRVKPVKEAGTLPEWDPQGMFAAELEDILKHLQTNYDATESHPAGFKKKLADQANNFNVNWDEKKRAGLLKLKEMLANAVVRSPDCAVKLGDMKLSEWENILDALKSLFGT
jgi:hypothetical protein